MVEQGFKRILIVNGHGGNTPAQSLTGEWMADHSGVRVKFHNWWNAPKAWAHRAARLAWRCLPRSTSTRQSAIYPDEHAMRGRRRIDRKPFGKRRVIERSRVNSGSTRTILVLTFSAEAHRSAQHFHRVSANANVRDTLAVSRCSHIHFARTTNLDALSNQHLFVTVCDPVLDHPTRGATGR